MRYIKAFILQSQIFIITNNQLMKKINYGNRDKTKEKKNSFIQALKDDEDDVCGAVLDSFSNEYLSYISGLVKNSKTPLKMRTQERIQALFDNKDKQTTKELKQTPLNIAKNNKNIKKQTSPNSLKSEQDYKNSTVPLKNLRERGQINQTGHLRKQRQKSLGATFQQNLNNQSKMERKFNLKLKQHYNRFPTQQAQKNAKSPKYDHTSIVCSDQSGRNFTDKIKKIDSGKQFLQGIDQYLVSLQINKNFKKQQNKKYSTKLKNEQDIKTIEELYQQNIKLRKKLRKYEQKMIQVEQNMQNHFIHCKKQQKTQKIKINDLTKALLRAITKVNQQKEQIQQMKDQLRNFGRKAQFCVDKYSGQSSDGDQQIQQSFLKVMRPSRASSQYKMKKKKTQLANLAIFDRD